MRLLLRQGEVPKERGAVKSQPVVKAPPVAPPPPKGFPVWPNGWRVA